MQKMSKYCKSNLIDGFYRFENQQIFLNSTGIKLISNNDIQKISKIRYWITLLLSRQFYS